MSAPGFQDRDDSPKEIFDPEELLTSIHDDHDLLQQFIHLFFQDFPGKINRLQDVAPPGDTDLVQLRDAAHKILGSARTMRMRRLGQASLELQQLIDSEEYAPTDLTATVSRIVDEYHQVLALLKRYPPGHGSSTPPVSC